MRRFKQFCLIILSLATIAEAITNYNPKGNLNEYIEDAVEGRSRRKNQGSEVHYDQRQSGKYNLQVNLKDVQIIAVSGQALGGDFGDYDYSYDYDQLTSKPILSLLGSLSGNKPSSTTNAPNITAGSTSITSESVNTASLNSTNDGEKNSTSITDPNYPQYILPDQIPVEVIIDKLNKTEEPLLKPTTRKPITDIENKPTAEQESMTTTIKEVVGGPVIANGKLNSSSRKYSVEIMGKDETLAPSRPIRGKIAPKIRNVQNNGNHNRRRVSPGLLTLRRLVNIANMFKDKEDRDD